MRGACFATWVALCCVGCETSDTADHGTPVDAKKSALVVDAGAARAALTASLSRDPANLVEVERSDGVRQVRVHNGFQHATVVRREPDGSHHQHCVSSSEEAARFLDEAAR